MKRLLWFAVLIAGLLGVNFALAHGLFLHLKTDYIEHVVLTAGIFVILAVSLNLVNGFTGQFSLGHAGFYGIGAYVGAALTVFGQTSIFRGWFTPDGDTTWYYGAAALVIAMLLGGLAAAVAGLIVGLPSLKLRGDYLAIVTLGFNSIIIVVLNNLDIVGGARGFQGIYKGDSLVSVPSLSSFFWIFLIAALVIYVSISIRNSVHGLAFISIREDEVAAEAMGIPTTKYKVLAFTLSAFFAGVAGVLWAHLQGRIDPTNFVPQVSINIVVMVVLGGLGSVSGTAIGALLLTVLPEYLRAVDQYRLIIYSLLLIALMLLRPRGIFGHEEISRKWLRNQITALQALPNRIAARRASGKAA